MKYSATDMYARQKAKMIKFISTLQGSKGEAIQLQDDLNQQLGLIQAPWNITEDSSLIDQFLYNLGQALEVEISNSLGVVTTDEMTNVVPQAKAKEVLQKISKRDKMFNQISNPSGANTVRQSDVTRILNKLSYIIKADIGDPAALKKLKEIQKELLELNNKVEWHKIGKGANLILDKSTDSGKMAYRINKLLNYANALITIQNVSNEVGIIGEQGIAAMFLIANTKKEDLTSDFIDQISQGLLGGDSLKSGSVALPNGLRMSVVGDSKSRKGYYSKEVSRFTPGATQSASGKFVSFGATDDKVDIEFQVSVGNNESKTITASVKNYSNPSQVTILQGNIFPILANYTTFMNHYLKLISSTETPQEDLNYMYQAIKFTTGIHALVGGVKALNDQGNVITTATAQYFIVNDNRFKGAGIKVYSTNDIAKQILDNVDLIELLKGDKIDDQIISKAEKARGNIFAYNDEIADVDNRFASIEVILKLNQLKQSI